MSTKLLFFFLICICCCRVFSQEIFLHVAPGRIFKLEKDYSLTLIATETYSTSISAIGDIAIDPNHVLYGISTSGEIIVIDWVTGHATAIAQLPSDEFYNSLTCSSNFELISLTDHGNLYRYNIQSDSMVLLDHIEHATPGDLCFYKGNLVFQSSTDSHITAYHMLSGSVTTILCNQLPLMSDAGLWGISNQHEDCDFGRILATDNASHLFQLHIEKGTIELLEYYDSLSFPQAYDIYGMASDNEYLASECDFEFPIVICDASDLDDLSESDFLIYPNPVQATFSIRADIEVNKVEVLDFHGRILGSPSATNKGYELDGLSDGLYIVRVYTSGAIFMKTIYKNK